MRCFYILAVIPFLPFLPSVLFFLLSPIFLNSDHFDFNACWKLDQAKCTITSKVVASPINVSADVIGDLKSRLGSRRPIAEVPRFTSATEGAKFDSEYGLIPSFLDSFLKYWQHEFDWKSQVEDKLNKMNPSATTIDGLKTHFLHLHVADNKKKVGVLFLHGWPGSIWEFHKIVPALQQNASFMSTYDIVVPSLHGYGWSEAAEVPGMSVCQMGMIFHKLMTRVLVYEHYVCQGGDWGSMICRCMAGISEQDKKNALIGIHLNFFPGSAPFIANILAPQSIPSPKKLIRSFPYFLEQSSVPNTIGLVLRDSPTSLAAWILEKMVVWCDLVGDNQTSTMTMEDYAANIMLYWVTDSIFTSVRLYKEAIFGINKYQGFYTQTHVPTALMDFKAEILRMTGNEMTHRMTYRKLLQFGRFEQGGHFAALEQPQLLVDDLTSFLAKITI